MQFTLNIFWETIFQEFFNNEIPHFYECIFGTHSIGDKMQSATVIRFVKVGYNVKFEFHETKFQN